MGSVLEISDLDVRYRTVDGDSKAVDGANLTVARGEVLGIAGESGSGKSTLATTVLRLLRPPGYVAGGSVILRPQNSEPVDLLAADERSLRSLRWKSLAYLPQGSMNSLNPVMTVQDQFLDVLRLHVDEDRGVLVNRVRELLVDVGLSANVAQMYAHELSGGMKQRVLMALAVALHPDVLIADEPTTALDVTIQRVIIQNLLKLREEFGLTIVVITHDMGVHAQLVDRVAVMYEGRIVEVGGVDQIFHDPHHEYTERLIRSIPVIGSPRRTEATAPPLGTQQQVELTLHGVTQVYTRGDRRRFKAVNDVSLSLRSNSAEIVSLVGASGSGKSTVARLLLALQKPTDGRVTYGGANVFHLSRSDERLFRQNVQPVFQDPYSIFNPFYRVDRVFVKAIKKFRLADNAASAAELVRSSLRAVKLDPDTVLGRYPHQLSGGQRQRLMLARVHMLRPSFIIADEPVSMLDAQVRRSFLDLLLEFRDRYGMTTLFITHDLSTVAYLGGQMITMFNGRIVEDGPVDRMLLSPQHEYTKLLIASVPPPDPRRRWNERVEVVGGIPRVISREIDVVVPSAPV